MTRFGYGTNGFSDHRLDDALAILADLGYDGVALTLDHQHLDPFAPDLPRRVAALARSLDRLGLDVVIETGARYLLDPWRKHQPTLVSAEPEGRALRVDLLTRAVRIAAELGAQAVSFWSGTAPEGCDAAVALDRLATGCATVLAAAQDAGVVLGFEPEPGMAVDTLDRFEQLRALLGRPDGFGVTLDIGHCRCLEPMPVADCVARVADHLVNVQIDDMRRGVHEHLEFGRGEIDFPPVLRALSESGYPGLVSVELPRHSHAAVRVASESLTFLKQAAQATARGNPDELLGLYYHGDADEKRAILLSLDHLDIDERALPIVEDALRCNDTRLITAALGSYAARHLSAHAYRHAILKCVFCGIPLAAVSGVNERADAELARMLNDFALERIAAGRPVPDDVRTVLARFPEYRSH
jgi:sugar phosphate isomerase/epimerase